MTVVRVIEEVRTVHCLLAQVEIPDCHKFAIEPVVHVAAAQAWVKSLVFCTPVSIDTCHFWVAGHRCLSFIVRVVYRIVAEEALSKVFVDLLSLVHCPLVFL